MKRGPAEVTFAGFRKTKPDQLIVGVPEFQPYDQSMTKDQIEAVLDRVHSWPKARQEDAARVLLAMEAQAEEEYALSEDERADLHTALDEVARGDLAMDAEVEAVFARLEKRCYAGGL